MGGGTAIGVPKRGRVQKNHLVAWRAIHAFVRATVGVVSVKLWEFGVARGGVGIALPQALLMGDALGFLYHCKPPPPAPPPGSGWCLWGEGTVAPEMGFQGARGVRGGGGCRARLLYATPPPGAPPPPPSRWPPDRVLSKMHCTTRRGVVQGVGARRVGSVRRVVQCRTRRRGPTCRGCTTRRTVSYKVSYSTDTVRHSTTQYDTVRHSTTQYDTVRHSTTRYDTVRHGTTQYDTVRHSTTWYDTVRHSTSHTDIYICRHINTCKWKKKQIGQNGAKWVQMRFHFGQNSPKGETSNIGTSRLQHADSVYN